MAGTPRTQTRGIIRALWSLVKPDDFKSRKPSHRNLVYREGRGQRGIKPRADLYLPEGAGPHPSLLLIHGGGYLIGSNAMKPMRFLATRAVEAGWAALSVDYRMIFRGGRFEEALSDVREATGWWLEHAQDYGCDPARVAMLVAQFDDEGATYGLRIPPRTTVVFRPADPADIRPRGLDE